MFCGVNRLRNNTIYPFLKRSLQQRWITEWAEMGERGKPRSVCGLTSTGWEALVGKLKEFPDSDASSGDVFRLCVGLFRLLRRPDRERILTARDGYLQYRIQQFRELDFEEIPPSLQWRIPTTRFFVEQLELERKWISQLRFQNQNTPESCIFG